MSARAYRNHVKHVINKRARELEEKIPRLRYRDFHRLLREVRRIE